MGRPRTILGCCPKLTPFGINTLQPLISPQSHHKNMPLNCHARLWESREAGSAASWLCDGPQEGLGTSSLPGPNLRNCFSAEALLVRPGRPSTCQNPGAYFCGHFGGSPSVWKCSCLLAAVSDLPRPPLSFPNTSFFPYLEVHVFPFPAVQGLCFTSFHSRPSSTVSLANDTISSPVQAEVRAAPPPPAPEPYPWLHKLNRRSDVCVDVQTDFLSSLLPNRAFQLFTVHFFISALPLLSILSPDHSWILLLCSSTGSTLVQTIPF